MAAQSTDNTPTLSAASSGAAVSYPHTLKPESLGDVLCSRHEYAAALDAYRRAPPGSRIWGKIGVAYHHMLALDEALKYYQMALQQDPHNPILLSNVAAVHHGKRDFGNAVRFYRMSLQYDPENARTYLNLGTTYFAEGKYQEGAQAYNQAMAINPRELERRSNDAVDTGGTRQENVARHYYLARAFARAGQQNRALEYLRKALAEGFHDHRKLEAEQDFSQLRRTTEFQSLLAAH